MQPINVAKKMVKARLHDFGYDNRVSARMIDFTDLARSARIFVTVHDWQASSTSTNVLESIKSSAPGCIVTFSGPGIIG